MEKFWGQLPRGKVFGGSGVAADELGQGLVGKEGRAPRPEVRVGVGGSQQPGAQAGEFGGVVRLGSVVKVASSVAVEDEIPVGFAFDLSGQRKDLVHRLGFFGG
ncbi:hypothetical protein [Streptomyces griseoflavus]|uniref:hypothetical protein n=1 Tax=Streptomyces griseoflavus TaxID=35619 RepID=UPI003D702928